MPTTSHITLAMLIAEQKRIGAHMKKHYPSMVKEQKITPYERDHRLRCNEKLLELLLQAEKNKNIPGAPKFLDILNNIP